MNTPQHKNHSLFQQILNEEKRPIAVYQPVSLYYLKYTR